MPDGKHSVVKLLMLFRCSAGGRDWFLALVKLFRTVKAPHQSVTGMRQVAEYQGTAFVEVPWIVRSVFLSPKFNQEEYFFVNDLVDTDCASDMYLRLKDLSFS